MMAPPGGQTVVVPVTGQDGKIVHLQVSTLLPSQSQSQPRYKYINPSVPPPGYQDRDSWSSQVEDFLTRPRANKRKVEEETSVLTEKVKRNNFTARAPVVPPSPSSTANELDLRPDNKVYLGDILVRLYYLLTNDTVVLSMYLLHIPGLERQVWVSPL